MTKAKPAPAATPRRGVRDELFRNGEFFDPNDPVQVKYEMLRRVQNDGYSVSQAANAFGFSRTSFYVAKAAFEQAGLAGLVPQRRGKGEKLPPEVIAFVRRALQEDASLSPVSLAEMARQRFGVSLPPRTIIGALLGRRR